MLSLVLVMFLVVVFAASCVSSPGGREACASTFGRTAVLSSTSFLCVPMPCSLNWMRFFLDPLYMHPCTDGSPPVPHRSVVSMSPRLDGIGFCRSCVCVCVSMAPLLFLIAPWYQRPPVSMELAFADLVCVCSFLCCPWHEYDKLRAES
jgi:hypothetical protein